MATDPTFYFVVKSEQPTLFKSSPIFKNLYNFVFSKLEDHVRQSTKDMPYVSTQALVTDVSYKEIFSDSQEFWLL